MKIEYISYGKITKILYDPAELTGSELIEYFLYTGKKDMDGKKIYDGNLLMRPGYEPDAIYEVCWNELESSWGLLCPPYTDGIYDFLGVGDNTSVTTEWKIIGHKTDNA